MERFHRCGILYAKQLSKKIVWTGKFSLSFFYGKNILFDKEEIRAYNE